MNLNKKKMKRNKIIYWSATGLLSALLVMSAGMYLFNHAQVAEMFTAFGYPTYIIYPLAVAKLAAVFVLVTQKQTVLKEWAYSALFFEFILAFFAHIMIGDGGQTAAFIAIILLAVSYIFGRKTFKTKSI